MNRITYTAIPILVYIPVTDQPFDELAELMELRSAAPKGSHIYVAEDYDNATVTRGEDEQLSADIHKVCHFVDGKTTPTLRRPTTALLQEIRLEISRLNQAAGETRFNPAITSLLDDALIDSGSPPPMAAACDSLSDLGASYEYPGYINIEKDRIDFAFGDLNGDYTFDFSTDPSDRGTRESGASTLPRNSSTTTLANWIREQVHATCAKYTVDHLPPYLHVNAILPDDHPNRPAIIMQSEHHDFCCCDPEDNRILLYEENCEDSPRLIAFAAKHGLKLIGTDERGHHHPWPEPSAPSTTHSPGPWNISKHATPEHSPQFGIYSGDNHHDLAIIVNENAAANARLIAAAPDLLAALKLVVEDFADWFNFKDDDQLQMLRNSINKAQAAITQATTP